MNAGGAPRDNADPLHVRWGRRAVTIPAYSLAALLLLSVTPILLPGVVVADVVGRRNFALVRSLLIIDVYLLAEALGILASLVIWATFGGWQREASPAYLKRNFSLQCRWAAVLFWSARRIFRLRLEVDGEECVRTGPLFVIDRHVSPIDNLVPAAFVSARHGLRLRARRSGSGAPGPRSIAGSPRATRLQLRRVVPRCRGSHLTAPLVRKRHVEPKMPATGWGRKLDVRASLPQLDR